MFPTRRLHKLPNRTHLDYRETASDVVSRGTRRWSTADKTVFQRSRRLAEKPCGVEPAPLPLVSEKTKDESKDEGDKEVVESLELALRTPHAMQPFAQVLTGSTVKESA